MSWSKQMAAINWLKQGSDKPLFPDVLWSRPENRRLAGKLLIAGGNQHGFAAPAAAYAAAANAGIGASRVLLPDKLQKTVGRLFPEAEFAPSTISGSFARQALAQFMDSAEWADGVLLAGDFGRNSETVIVLEKFIEKYPGQLSLTGDSVDYLLNQPAPVLSRDKTVIICSLPQLQKLALPKLVIKMQDDLIKILDLLSIFTGSGKAAVVTVHAGQIIVAGSGRVSATPAKKVDTTSLAAYVSVWAIQQPQKPFEALTTAIYCYQEGQ